MHANLEELRVEYSEKMAIIEEIKREKELREQQLKMKKDQKMQYHAEVIKDQADRFKVER